jgi:serine/threonine protein kinase
MKKGRSFKEWEIWNVLIQVARAHKAEHDLKVFHRDLKVHPTDAERQRVPRQGW